MASALLLDVGFVIIDPSPDAARAYERATGGTLPDTDMVASFRALAAVVPDSLFVPDAVTLIGDASAAGVPVGVLTNHAYAMLGRDWFAGRQEFAALRTFIDAAEIGYPKPDPQGYRLAAEQLGVAPAEIVFLDDTPECVDGARAVGMTGIVVDPRDRRPAFVEARRLLGIGR